MDSITEKKTLPSKPQNNRVLVIFMLLLIFLLLFSVILTILCVNYFKEEIIRKYDSSYPINIPTVVVPEVTKPLEEKIQNNVRGKSGFFVLDTGDNNEIYLNADFPEGTTIEYVTDYELNLKTRVKVNSQELLTFSHAKTVDSQRVSEHSEITRSVISGLYRIQNVADSAEYYSNRINFEGVCEGDQSSGEPCSDNAIYLNLEGKDWPITVEFIGNSENVSIADQIMKSVSNTTLIIEAEGLTSFYSEPLYGSLSKRDNYHAVFPKGASIEYVYRNHGGMRSVVTVIKYNSKELIVLTSFYELYPESIQTYTEIKNSQLEGLYRISPVAGGEFYTTDLQIDEPCESIDIKMPPCGLTGINTIVELSKDATVEDKIIADEIMRTLVIED